MTEHQFEEAMSRMVCGDKEALREIYENYLGYIYRIIYEILQSRENAEDVTSEFFIKLWDKAEQFKPGTGHKGYLAAMARNMAIDFLRKHRREELTAMLQDIEGEDREAESTGMIGAARSSADVEGEALRSLSVEEALAMLKPGERQIVSMKVLGELTFQEISKIMSIPMGTVTWKYQNAIKKLRRCGYE